MTDVSNGTEDGALEFNTAINGSTVALLDIAKTAANTVTIKDGDYFFNVASHDGTHGLKLGGTVVTSNAVNINYLSGLSRGTAAANQALVIGALPSGSSKFLQSTTGGVLTWESPSVAADDISTGDAAITLTSSTGAITIDSQDSSVTIDGHTGVNINSTSSGNITLNSVKDISLNANGAEVYMKTNGVTFATFSNTGDHILTSAVSAKPVLELKNTNDDAGGKRPAGFRRQGRR